MDSAFRDPAMIGSRVFSFLGVPTKRSQPSPAQTVALGLGTLSAIYLCLIILRPFVAIFAWSIALAVAIYPTHQRVKRVVHNQSLAAATTLLLATVVLCVPALWIGHLLLQAWMENVASLATYTSQEHWLNVERVPDELKPLFLWLEESLHVERIIKDFISSVAQRVPRMVTTSIMGALQFLLILFTTFFFIRDTRLLLFHLRSLIPLSRGATERILLTTFDTVHATLFGIVFVAGVQGLLGGIIFWWLGLPRPIVWGIVMAGLAIVPYLGAFVIWIPAAMGFAMHGDWPNAVILTFWGSTIIGLSDNVLYPILVGKRLHFHTLPIFFFLLGGIATFGAAGIVLGPALLAISHGLLGIWRDGQGDDEREQDATPPVVYEAAG